jgi:hypothetical protein
MLVIYGSGFDRLRVILDGERLMAFRKLCLEYDPVGKFRNDWAEQHLWPTATAEATEAPAVVASEKP